MASIKTIHIVIVTPLTNWDEMFGKLTDRLEWP